MLRIWWRFDSGFPEGGIYYFDVNFLQLAGAVVLGPLAGHLSDVLPVRLRRRGLSILGLFFFIVGFIFQFAYRTPLTDRSKWSRTTMVPAFVGMQLGITFLEISSRAILTDFGFTYGHGAVQAVASALAGVADLVVYGALRFAVRVPGVPLIDPGWDPQALRNTQIGLGVVSALAVVLSTISGEEPAEVLTRPPLGASLYSAEECPNFWAIAAPYGLAAAAYHQVQLVTPQLFFWYLGLAIEGYGDGFWLGCIAFMIAGGIAAVTGWSTQLCGSIGALRTAFCLTQLLSAVLLTAFSWACKGTFSLTTVYALTGVGLGVFNVVPFAVLGGCVPRGQVGRHVGLMVTFGIVCQQTVQGDFFANFMDNYYPWPHVWVFLALAGFFGSGFPNTDQRVEGGDGPPQPTSPLLLR